MLLFLSIFGVVCGGLCAARVIVLNQRLAELQSMYALSEKQLAQRVVHESTHVVYVDSKTGQVIGGSNGYRVGNSSIPRTFARTVYNK